MIKFDQCEEITQPVRYTDGANLTISTMKPVLEEKFKEYGLNVMIEFDQIKSGGLFNSTVDDCIMISNTDHPNDYYKHLIVLKKQGNIAYVSIYGFGKSKQMNKLSRVEFAKEDRKGKKMSYKVGSIIGSGIRNIGMNKDKLQEEKMYYDAVITVLQELIS